MGQSSLVLHSHYSTLSHFIILLFCLKSITPVLPQYHLYHSPVPYPKSCVWQAQLQVSFQLLLIWVEHPPCFSKDSILYHYFSLPDYGLNSGLHTCKAGALPLEPQLQFILSMDCSSCSFVTLAGAKYCSQYLCCGRLLADIRDS
jgi:hypothetical protein